jgi:hypothetical protein
MGMHAYAEQQRALRISLLMTSGFVSLSVHLKVRAGAEAKDVLRRAHEAMASQFKVLRSIFQIEPEEDASCATGSCDVKPPTSA